MPTKQADHRRKTLVLLVESITNYAALFIISFALAWPEHARIGENGVLEGDAARYVALGICAGLQGIWLHRLYVVGHEASHGKLWPTRRWLNDVIGQALLLPHLLPLLIHRKIHRFHHGFNRRDPSTSALDTYVLHRDSWVSRRWCQLLWYVAVFAGGFFVHGLISVVFFLMLPLPVARKVSPAFHGWTLRDQGLSAMVFFSALSLQVFFANYFGVSAWFWTCLAPLLVFAWLYSLFVYIYHYDTGYGKNVHEHVRSLRPHRLASWILLNFHEHSLHHRHPGLPWYALPDLAQKQASSSQPRLTLLQAIVAQARGPRIVLRHECIATHEVPCEP